MTVVWKLQFGSDFWYCEPVLLPWTLPSCVIFHDLWAQFRAPHRVHGVCGTVEAECYQVTTVGVDSHRLLECQ
jgi:hypothetical protein